MKFHLDRRIILREDSEYPSLYGWFLREEGENTPPHQRDQIPWSWSQVFSVTEMTLATCFECELSWGDNSDIASKAWISATLSPMARSDRIDPETRYSMFGTDRIISDFSLRIHPTDKPSAQVLRAWGCVRHEYEIDFCTRICPDGLQFNLGIGPTAFERLSGLISNGALTSATLRVGHVDGFYSDWSPQISTALIKILAGDEKAHDVSKVEGCSVSPPRLGKVGEFDLTLATQRIFVDRSNAVDNLEGTLGSEDSMILRPINSPNSESNNNNIKETTKLIKSIQLGVWASISILFLLLLGECSIIVRS